jgi:hypothetical protein
MKKKHHLDSPLPLVSRGFYQSPCLSHVHCSTFDRISSARGLS